MIIKLKFILSQQTENRSCYSSSVYQMPSRFYTVGRTFKSLFLFVFFTEKQLPAVAPKTKQVVRLNQNNGVAVQTAGFSLSNELKPHSSGRLRR